MGEQIKNKEQKKSSKTIDIFSYGLKVSVNGVTCVFAVHFRSSDIKSFVNWLNS